MPKYGRRRSTYKRRKVYRRRTLGRKVKSLTRKVKKIQSNIETKKIDISTTSDFNLPAAEPTVPPFCKFIPTIKEGDDVDQREGREISAKTLSLKLLLTAINNHSDPTAWTSSTRASWNVRVMIVKFLNSFSHPSAIALGDLLQNNAKGYNVFSPINWTNRKRYKILYDKVFQITHPNYLGDVGVDGACVAADPSMNKLISKRIKLNTKITYNGPGEETAVCQQNGIYLLAWSDGSSDYNHNAGYNIVGRYSYRLTFQDL